MKQFLFSFAMLLTSTTIVSGQEAIVNQEVELASLLDSLRSAKDDASREAWNTQFKTQMLQSLNEPSALIYPFSRLRTVGVIDSPDKQMRIVCWNVEQQDGSQKYYAFVLKADERKGTHKVIELIDRSEILMPRTDEVLDANNWYGALYYKIIPVEKNNKTYYTLLGWDGATTASNIKLIDVLYFTGNSLKLGAPIFKNGDELKRRIYMEHSERATMTLNWDADQQRIMFDHLSPETPTMEGFYEYYVPDLSYDAYVYNGTKWVLIEDVIGLSKHQQVVKLHAIDPKTGEIEETEMDSKWIDPTSGGSPAGKEVHIAMTPDMEGADTKKSDKSADEKTAKKGEPKNALEIWDQKKRHKKEKANSPSYANEGKKKKKKK
jgi:hypothetical protein